MLASSPSLRDLLARQGIGSPQDRAAHLARMSVTARASDIGPEEAAPARIRLQVLMGCEGGTKAFAQAVCDYLNGDAVHFARDFEILLGPVSEWLAKAEIPAPGQRLSPDYPPELWIVSRMLVAAGVVSA